MNKNRNILIKELEESFKKSLLLIPSENPNEEEEFFFKSLTAQGFYNLSDIQLKKLLITTPRTVINFILDVGEGDLTSLEELIEAIAGYWGGTPIENILIEEKFKENISPLLSETFKKARPMTFRILSENYLSFYKQLTLNELLYFYKDLDKLKVFDQVLFELSFLDEDESIYYDGVFPFIEQSLKIIEKYDESMPLKWFIEFHREEFNKLTPLVF